MRRVFTDERFPGLEVHNYGDNRFVVMDNGAEIDSFTTFAHQGELPLDTAQRRAQDYFNRMANGRMSAELSDSAEFGDNRAADAPAKASKSKPLPKREPETDVPYGLSASKSLDDMTGNNVLTADDIIDRYQQAKAIQDPEQKEKMMAQLRSASQQLESNTLAEEVVRGLLQ